MKFRIRISFDLPDGTDPKVASAIIHKTFSATQKLLQGELEFRIVKDPEMGRMSILIQSSKILPDVDALKIRLPGLKRLEIVDASLN
jgi:hypothetical protein